jgi:hypothetical protein
MVGARPSLNASLIFPPSPSSIYLPTLNGLKANPRQVAGGGRGGVRKGRVEMGSWKTGKGRERDREKEEKREKGETR